MPVVALGLAAVLESGGEYQMTSICTTAAELRDAIKANDPEIVLLDFTADFTVSILAELGPSLLSRNVILLVYEITQEMLRQATALGVRGILRSTLGLDCVTQCLQKVREGGTWFEKSLVDEAMEGRRASLTGREAQLVRLLGQGLKNREIAEALSITEGTVKVYLSRLFHKLGVKDRFELALYGMMNPAAGTVRLPRSPLARRGLLRQGPARGRG